MAISDAGHLSCFSQPAEPFDCDFSPVFRSPSHHVCSRLCLSWVLKVFSSSSGLAAVTPCYCLRHRGGRGTRGLHDLRALERLPVQHAVELDELLFGLDGRGGGGGAVHLVHLAVQNPDHVGLVGPRRLSVVTVEGGHRLFDIANGLCLQPVPLLLRPLLGGVGEVIIVPEGWQGSALDDMLALSIVQNYDGSGIPLTGMLNLSASLMASWEFFQDISHCEYAIT